MILDYSSNNRYQEIDLVVSVIRISYITIISNCCCQQSEVLISPT